MLDRAVHSTKMYSRKKEVRRRGKEEEMETHFETVRGERKKEGGGGKLLPGEKKREEWGCPDETFGHFKVREPVGFFGPRFVSRRVRKWAHFKLKRPVLFGLRFLPPELFRRVGC